MISSSPAENNFNCTGPLKVQFAGLNAPLEIKKDPIMLVEQSEEEQKEAHDKIKKILEEKPTSAFVSFTSF